jgi:ribosome-binding factor A
MASGQRAARVADQIQRELAELVRTELKDPRVGMITLTGVEVSPDLAHAKVFFSTFTEAGRAETLQGLKRAAGFLRSQLGRRLSTHNIPELHFQFDASVERGMQLSALIDRAVADHAPDDEPPAGGGDAPAGPDAGR